MRSLKGPGSSGIKSTLPEKPARIVLRIRSASSTGLNWLERKIMSPASPDGWAAGAAVAAAPPLDGAAVAAAPAAGAAVGCAVEPVPPQLLRINARIASRTTRRVADTDGERSIVRSFLRASAASSQCYGCMGDGRIIA